MFETLVRYRLNTLLADVQSEIVVDFVHRVENGSFLVVSFHLEGAWASPAELSFPFRSDTAIDQSLAGVRALAASAHISPSMTPLAMACN